MAKKKPSGFGPKWRGRGPSKKPLPKLLTKLERYEQLLKKFQQDKLYSEFEIGLRLALKKTAKEEIKGKRVWRAGKLRAKLPPHYEVFVKERLTRLKLRREMLQEKFDTAVKRLEKLEKHLEKLPAEQAKHAVTDKEILVRYKSKKVRKAIAAQFRAEDDYLTWFAFHKALLAKKEVHEAAVPIIYYVEKDPQKIKKLQQRNEEALDKLAKQIKEAERILKVAKKRMNELREKARKVIEEYDKKRKKK